MTGSSRLVVNADDFGMTPAISRGILRAHRCGIVTSCSVIGNCDDLRSVELLPRQAPSLGVGLHLTVVGGLPVSPPAAVDSIVDRTGRFQASWRRFLARLPWADVDDIEREFDAQVARVRDIGVPLDHLDTHQHIGALPAIARIVAAVARRHGIRAVRAVRLSPRVDWLGRPGRMPALIALAVAAHAARRGSRSEAPRTWGVVESGRLDEPRLVSLLRTLPQGDHELICHPGEADEPVACDPAWQYQWRRELDALTSPAVRSMIEARGIALCTWRELRG